MSRPFRTEFSEQTLIDLLAEPNLNVKLKEVVAERLSNQIKRLKRFQRQLEKTPLQEL